MKRLILLLPLVSVAGCIVRQRPAEVEYRSPAVEVEPAARVVEGGVVVDVLPPPAERVYIYDPGYPPGSFFWGGFVYYGGYRYERDVFVHRYVERNIRENRYVEVERNRRMGRQYEVRHREEFEHYHGHRPDRR